MRYAITMTYLPCPAIADFMNEIIPPGFIINFTQRNSQTMNAVDRPRFYVSELFAIPVGEDFSIDQLMQHLFPASHVPSSVFNHNIIQVFSKKLSLPYQSHGEVPGMNASPVCFAESEEVRPEYQVPLPATSFSDSDIAAYVLACAVDQAKQFGRQAGEIQISYPENQVSFFREVRRGEQIRANRNRI